VQFESAIEADNALAGALKYVTTPAVKGKLKVTPKKELRKLLGRSTDRADAVLLTVWRPATWDAAVAAGEAPAPPPPPPPGLVYEEPRSHGLDPYAGADAWGGRG
jgi:hypothetical protein